MFEGFSARMSGLSGGRTACRLYPATATEAAALRFSLGTGKETVPETIARLIFYVAPGKVAVLTVKFFRKDFERKKDAGQRRREKFPRQLRIFDPRRSTLRATNRRADLRIGRFPFHHQLLRRGEIFFVHVYFHVGLGLGHESHGLEMLFGMNV